VSSALEGDPVTWSRRSFVAAAAAWPAGPAALGAMRAGGGPAGPPTPRPSFGTASFEPWIDVDPAAIVANTEEIARLAGGRPVLAVVKNNAYGLGVALLGRALRSADAVAGAAVVTPAAAHELLDAGFDRPVLLMARADDGDAEDLVRRGVRLATADGGAAAQIGRLAARMEQPIPIHVYVDTGMSRLGVPFRAAGAFLEALHAARTATVEGVFTGLAEEDDFDALQLERLRGIVEALRSAEIPAGRIHAASSHALFFRPEALLDMVRPGLTVFGAYPAGARATGAARLRVGFRLRARVARLERLEPGDGVSYGQTYVASRPTWVATLPVGHADGYPRRAVEGCEVLVGARTYRVIGAVSASHTILEIGDDPTVAIGDVATLIGPDHPAIHPNTIAERAGISVYDVLMHLGARVPRALAAGG